MDPVTGCPDDYEELFVNYFPMMIGIVARSGIAPEDVEDVTMDILAKFIEKGGIAYYDPDRLNDVGTDPDLPGPRYRKAKFKGMLRGFTATYVMQYRDKQMIRHRFFPYRLEKSAGKDETGASVTFADLLPPTEPIEPLDISVSIVHAIRTARETLVSKSTPTRNYAAYLDVAIEFGLLDGKINRRMVRETLGISESVEHSMLKETRGTLRPLLVDLGIVA